MKKLSPKSNSNSEEFWILYLQKKKLNRKKKIQTQTDFQNLYYSQEKTKPEKLSRKKNQDNSIAVSEVEESLLQMNVFPVLIHEDNSAGMIQCEKNN